MNQKNLKNRHIFVIKDILENKPVSSTMAFVRSLKMKPDMYKPVLLKKSENISPEIEIQFRVKILNGTNFFFFKSVFISRFIIQGFINEQKFITFEQLYDVFRLVSIINKIDNEGLEETSYIFQKLQLKSFCGILKSIYKIKIK